MKHALAGLLLLLFALQVSAASCSTVTISTSPSSSRLTTGTNAVITATLSSSESCNGDVRLVSTGSGTGASLTVTDPAAGYYQSASISSGGTSKTFTVTGGTSDAYSYYVTAGSSQSSAQTLTFVNPEAFTVTGSPASVTNNQSGNSFTLSVTLTNPQSASITTSYALSYSGSYFTIAGDPTSSSSTTLSASSTRVLQWTVTLASAWSGTQNIVFQLGSNSNAFTTSVAYPAATATPTATATATAQAGTQGTNPGDNATPTPAPTLREVPTPTPRPTPTLRSVPLQTPTPTSTPAPTPTDKQRAEARMNQVRSLINQTKAKGLDTSKAEVLLKTAEDQFKQGKYPEALLSATQAKNLLDQEGASDKEAMPFVGTQSRANVFWFVIITAFMLLGVWAYYKLSMMQKVDAKKTVLPPRPKRKP